MNKKSPPVWPGINAFAGIDRTTANPLLASYIDEVKPFTWEEWSKEFTKQVAAEYEVFDPGPDAYVAADGPDLMLYGALQALLTIQSQLHSRSSDEYLDAKEVFWQTIYGIWHDEFTRWTKEDCYDLILLLAMWRGVGCSYDEQMDDTASRWLRKLAFTLTEKRKVYGKSLSEPLNVFSFSDSIEQTASRIDTKLARLMFCDPQSDTEDTRVDLAGYLALMIGLLEEQNA